MITAVPDACGRVLEKTDSGDYLSECDSLAFPDCVALNGRCGRKYHNAEKHTVDSDSV